MKLLTLDKPVRLIELFAGIGCQSMALKRLGVPFESWRISEWDVNAVRSYRAIHCSDNSYQISDSRDGNAKTHNIKALLKLGVSLNGKIPATETTLKRKSEAWLEETLANFQATRNIGSISNAHGEDLGIIDTDNYTYIMTYSFPCTDLSVAGKMRGMTEDSGTASSLLWQVRRLLEETAELPQILLMENVPQVANDKNKPQFQIWLEYLQDKGYRSVYQNLNAKDYGVPQNRERCFMVSWLGDYKYTFPEPIPLDRRLKDILEESVPERYYLSDETTAKLKLNPNWRRDKEITNTLLKFGIVNSHQDGEVYDEKGVSQCLKAANYKHSPLIKTD
jgi:DNA (cytosine-5)-methyltransferase 1